jgi:glycosyltransferase involved in cell wall biosynthesis
MRSVSLLIGIDSHGVEREGEGNATYARNLISALFRTSRDDDFVLFASDPEHTFYRSLPRRGHSRVVRTAQGKGLARVAWTLGWAASRQPVDVLHVQYLAPLWYRGPLVVTVHDLAFLHVPESFPPRLRVALKALVPLSIRRASRVIVGSEFTRRDILARYGIRPERITVVPHGLESRFQPCEAEDSARILARYGLQPGFLFSLGRLNPRKNLARLIQAHACMRQRGAPAVPLVIGGKPDGMNGVFPGGLQALEADGVRWMGIIPDEDLPAFYRGASAFIFPSLFEGFGLPVLEAMACGTPVVTSNRTSLPEVAGDAGLLVDPESIEALADAMARVLTDKVLARELRQRGLVRIHRYSRAKMAAHTLAVYHQVA